MFVNVLIYYFFCTIVCIFVSIKESKKMLSNFNLLSPVFCNIYNYCHLQITGEISFAVQCFLLLALNCVSNLQCSTFFQSPELQWLDRQQVEKVELYVSL